MSVQYQTVVPWDYNLRDAEYTDADTMPAALQGLVKFGIYIVTGTPVATPKVYLEGAQILNAVDSTWYENTGTTASPVWSLVPSSGSGMTELTGDVTAGPGSGSQAATIAAIDLETATVTNIATTEILIGTGAGTAAFAALSGDATMSNAGVVSVSDLTITGETAGDILYFNGTNWVKLAIGTAGQVLTVNGGATAPVWA